MKNLKLVRSLILILTLSAFHMLNMNGQVSGKKLDLDIVFIGNSITQGANFEKPLEDSPPAVACHYLLMQKGVNNAEFINQGRSGFTTVDFLPSAEGPFKEVITATLKFHKDRGRLLVFSVSLGTNDSAEEGPNGSPVNPESYCKNIQLIIDGLLAEFPEAKIFVQQPIFYSPNTYNRARYLAGGLARLQSYFPGLQSLVKSYSQSNPGHVFMGDLKGFDYFSKNYLTDLIPESGNAGTFYLHPNKKGARVLGNLWGEAIYQSIFKD